MDVTSTDTKEDSMNHAGDPSDSNDVHDRDQMHVDNAKTDASSISSPPILKHLVIGLNEVTKYLERHITRLRESMVGEKALSEDTSLPCALFACRWDLNPPTLISHIPHLVASFNTLANLYNAKFQTATAIPDLKLINLPKGAESSLSDCIGIRRVSMVLINVRNIVYSFLSRQTC
jgi:ribonuclease P/MRP protein subunit POP3